jgi:HSP20 family protein
MVFGYHYPRRPLHQLREEMDRLWTGFLDAADEQGIRLSRRQPPVDVWQRDNALIVELEAPGVKKDQVNVSVSGNELSIQVQRPEPDEEGVTYHRRERPFGTFNRVLQLPIDVDAEHVEAAIRDGVLTITLPKSESAKPRKINVAAKD